MQLFSEVSPSHPDYVTALSDMGHLYNDRQEVAAAIPFFRRAIAVAEAQPERNDAFLVNTHGNLGVALQCMRDFDGAEADTREQMRSPHVPAAKGAKPIGSS